MPDTCSAILLFARARFVAGLRASNVQTHATVGQHNQAGRDNQSCGIAGRMTVCGDDER